MPKPTTPLEIRLWIALDRIRAYTPPDRMRRNNERGQGYGLGADEEIAMAYENVIEEARFALKGVGRPVVRASKGGERAEGGDGRG